MVRLHSDLKLEAWNTHESCRTGTGSPNLVRRTRRGTISYGWRGSGEESSWCSESRKFRSSLLSWVDESEMSFPLLVLEDRGRQRGDVDATAGDKRELGVGNTSAKTVI